MPIELILIYFGIPLGLMVAVSIGGLFVFRQTRKLAKRLLCGFLIFFMLAIASFLLAESYREFRAHQIIKQVNPFIQGLEQYKTKKGVYPAKLDELVPGFIRRISETSVVCGNNEREGTYPDCAVIYRRENKAYLLSFRMDGPPFGYYFFYRPSHHYPRWEGVLQLELKKKIDQWGWYRKV